MEAQKLRHSAMNAEMLRFGEMLREPREMVSRFERDVARAVAGAGLDYKYEPYRFYIEVDGGTCMFVPDFRITNARIGSREIILEPHGFKSRRSMSIDDPFSKKLNDLAESNYFFKKLDAFMRSEGHDGRYFVLITDMRRDELVDRLGMLGMKPKDIADDIWFETSSDGTVAGYAAYLDKKAGELAGKARLSKASGGS